MKLRKLVKTSLFERPLSNVPLNGGYTKIFDTITVIGDSLSSGEFEVKDENNNMLYLDYYNYSWGKFIEKDTGSKVQIFGRGGLSSKDFCTFYGNEIDAYNEEKKTKAYIIALGVNELLNQGMEIGNIDHLLDVDTYARWMNEIINNFKKISKDAKFFILTMPKDTTDTKEKIAKKEKARELIYDLASINKNCYVIDLYKYAPKYDEKLRKKFTLNWHLNPMGYLYTAKMVESYIDYIVRKNFEDFIQVGLINEKFYDERLDK